MKKLLVAAAVCSLIPIASLANQAPKAEAPEADAESRRPGQRLIGHYHIKEGAKDGEEIPAEQLKDNTVAISKDTIAVVDRDKKELYSAKYKVSRGGERGLWNVDMESKVPKAGEKALGLLKRDGNKLWLIYAISGERPKSFDKTEKGQHLFKMERESKQPDLNEPAEKKP